LTGGDHRTGVDLDIEKEIGRGDLGGTRVRISSLKVMGEGGAYDMKAFRGGGEDKNGG